MNPAPRGGKAGYGELLHWKDDAGAERAAIWVVNVTDASLLPPPEELRDLRLEELLEVLTSARPLHEAVAQVIARREARTKITTRTLADLADPHKRVDTRNFLIRRMRRVAAALEGLRERLDRPAYSLEGLRWRLRGPVGPAKLAQRLAEEEPQAAAFFVAEVLLTLRQLDPERLGHHLGRDAIEAELDAVYRELGEQADCLTAPANLMAYVREAFAGVRP